MADFKLYNVVDSRLEDITDEISLPVVTGAKIITYNNIPQQGVGNTSQLQFNICMPEIATVLDRQVLIQSEISIKVDITGGTTAGYWEPNQILFNYGLTNALQAFPLNSLLSTIQATINSANVSVNTREVLPALLKLYKYEELAKYNSMTPSLVDSFYQNYTDGLYSNNNVLSNYSTGGFSKEYQPRGVFPVSLWITNAQNQLVELKDANGNNILLVQADATGTSPYSSFIIKFLTIEPLLFLSPFISGNSKNKAGLKGISALNFTLNFGSANRVMSNASYALDAAGVSTKTISNVSLSVVGESKILTTTMTLPTVLYKKFMPKNVVNYNIYQSFNNTVQTTIAKNFGSANIYSNSFQLQQVPTKILIYVMKGNLTSYDANSFLVITKCTMNFANSSGLLSNATPVQLYNMSVRNGLQMNYYEFSGKGISQNTKDGSPAVVPTIGSILVIDPAIDLSISDEVTNMSSGQFNIQFVLEVQNQSNEDLSQVTVYMTYVNSGLFITDSGVSTTTTGMLTQSQVLETKVKEAVMDKDTYEDDIVGGSIENINGIHKHMKLNFHKASEREKHLDKDPGESVSKIGFSSDGSGMAAAGMRARKKKIHKFAQ